MHHSRADEYVIIYIYISLCWVWQARVHKFHLHKGGILYYHDILAQVSLDPKVAFVSEGYQWAFGELHSVGWPRRCIPMYKSFTQLPCRTFFSRSVTCWMKGTKQQQKGCGIVHSKWFTCRLPSTQSKSLGACRSYEGYHVPVKIAADVPIGWAATNSPGWGHGPVPQWRSGQGRHQNRHGWTITTGRRRSTCWPWNGWRQVTTWQTLCRDNGTPWWHTALKCQAVQQSKISMKPFGAGNWGMSYGETLTQHYQQEPWRLAMDGIGLREPWQLGWMRFWKTRSTSCRRHVASVVGPRDASVPNVEWHHVGSVPGQETRMQSVVKRAGRQEEQPGLIFQRRAVVRPQGASCSDLSDSSQPNEHSLEDPGPQGGSQTRWTLWAATGLAMTTHRLVARRSYRECRTCGGAWMATHSRRANSCITSSRSSGDWRTSQARSFSCTINQTRVAGEAQGQDHREEKTGSQVASQPVRCSRGHHSQGWSLNRSDDAIGCLGSVWSYEPSIAGRVASSLQQTVAAIGHQCWEEYSPQCHLHRRGTAAVHAKSWSGMFAGESRFGRFLTCQDHQGTGAGTSFPEMAKQQWTIGVEHPGSCTSCRP